MTTMKLICGDVMQSQSGCPLDFSLALRIRALFTNLARSLTTQERLQHAGVGPEAVHGPNLKSRCALRMGNRIPAFVKIDELSSGEREFMLSFRTDSELDEGKGRVSADCLLCEEHAT